MDYLCPVCGAVAVRTIGDKTVELAPKAKDDHRPRDEKKTKAKP